MADSRPVLTSALRGNQREIIDRWLELQKRDMSLRNNLLKPGELEQQASEFLTAFMVSLDKGATADVATSESWTPVRDFLGMVSRSRAKQGFTPTETATFIYSLKQPLFETIRRELINDPLRMAEETWNISTLVDKLGLHTIDAYQRGREEVIARQQQELLELSTPVVRLWEGVLALPLIGTLDSARTQVVMESLLQAVVETGSLIAIIDITGVPVVDTLVAQHLLKTVAAARLMGADCIISGIRPQIAQTIVHLGVEINDVVTKATLADAFQVALKKLGMNVVRTKRAE